MVLFKTCRSVVLVFSLVITESLSAIIPEIPDNPPPIPEHEHVSKRATPINTIQLCIDCDGPCLSAISASEKKTATNYFNAIITQLNLIYTNSYLPLEVKLFKLTTFTTDIVLDPYGNFTSLQSGMDYYWKGARWSARKASGCNLAFLITDDPLFKKTSAGMSYVNSMCDNTYGYAISKWVSDIGAESARMAHELSHSMDINHVEDGSISFSNSPVVIINCNPDYCGDPTGKCITESSLSNPPPIMFSQCGRAIFFAWKAAGYGSCLGDMVPYYDPGSGL